MEDLLIRYEQYVFYVSVLYFREQKPVNPWLADTREECCGYTDFEIDILKIDEELEDGSLLSYDKKDPAFHDILDEKNYKVVYELGLKKITEKDNDYY